MRSLKGKKAAVTHRRAVRSQKAARDQACAQLFLGAFVFREPGLQDSRSGPVGHADRLDGSCWSERQERPWNHLPWFVLAQNLLFPQ